MGVLSRLFGSEQGVSERGNSVHVSAEQATSEQATSGHGAVSDERVLRRYRHVLGTAPSESLEQAHAEAFHGLREPQREAIYEELSRGAGTGERPLSSEPATLARSATRAERRLPGSLERTLRNADERGGFGGSLVTPVVDHVVGSPLVSAFLPWNG